MNDIVDLAPTMHSSAVLVSLKISTWNTKRKDKQSTEKVKADAGAMGNVGAYNKNLCPDFVALENLNKFTADCRNWVKRPTVPWGFDGVHMLSTRDLLTWFDKDMQTRHETFWNMVDVVLDEYANARQVAQFKLGTLFDASEYPTVDEVREKFRFDYAYYPVPETGDFRVDIAREGMEFLQKQFEKEKRKVIDEAMTSLWTRVKDITETLSNQLRVTKDEKGKLYQNTVDTALSLCDMMRDLNLTGDPKMDRVRKELKMTLEGVNLQELKKDEGQRLAVKQEIDDLLSKFDF